MKKIFLFLLLILMYSSVALVIAGDLDDGISSYKDEPVSKDDALGKLDKNVEFIVLRAKSRAAMQMDVSLTSDGDSSGNINSVVLRPGSTVTGDIIIVDNSYGSKLQVVGSGLTNVSSGLAESFESSDAASSVGGLLGGLGL